MPRSSREWLRRVLVVTAWIAGCMLLFAVTTAVSFYLALTMERRATQVVVPDLTGLGRDEAERTAQRLQLVMEVVDERHDPAVARGGVVQQQPAPGASVRRGRKVKVVLSLGGKVLEIPDTAGQADRQVEIELLQEGLSPGDEARVHSVLSPAGAVIAQVPPPGSPAVPGARVHRLVSVGPSRPRWVMPDLRGRALASVESWIKLGGFRQGPVRRLDGTGRPRGTVVGQLPLAGHPVEASQIVELTIAR